MRHTFQTVQWVPYQVETVFAFFANPENLPRLMPRWQDARIEKVLLVAPGISQVGRALEFEAAGKESRMTISFRPVPLSPIRIRWEALIVEFEWNRYFCDEQPKGPFKYWRHCHTVSAQERGTVMGTLITDDLVYEFPFGFLSEIAHALLLRRQIEGVFTYRHRQLESILSRNL